MKAGDEDEPATLPFCAGAFDMKPQMRYPSKALRQGRVGAVLISIDVENGRVSKAEVLAAVPNDGFADAVLETVQKWTWIYDEDASQEPCTRDAQGIRWPFTFLFAD